jgi:antitoxin VapB
MRLVNPPPPGDWYPLTTRGTIGGMALNIKDPETLDLLAKVAAATGETKTQAVRSALAEKQARLDLEIAERRARLTRVLEEEIWPLIPESERGRPITKAEREEILGYGPDGF